MIRFAAKIWARISYLFVLEVEASKNEINAGTAKRNAADKHKLAEQLNAEADAIDKNIEAEGVRLEAGYWECENGHEWKPSTAFAGIELQLPPKECYECHTPVKLIKLSKMTGQEKYELEKQKGDAQKIAAEKRALATQEAENATTAENATQMLQSRARDSRAFADKIRSL